MTRMVWIQVPIDSFHRDRKGGHGPSYATDDCGWNEPYKDKTARKIKKIGRRKQRRQHSKATAAALLALEADRALDAEEAMDLFLRDNWDEELDWLAYDDEPDDYGAIEDWSIYDDYGYDDYGYDFGDYGY